MPNKINLNGRVAAVTGGAQGIGYAIAARFAASGATVILLDKDVPLAKEAAARLGASVSAVEADVTRYDSLIAAVGHIESTHGTLDILVNNAGIAGMNAPLAEYPVEEWQKIMDINLNGVFYGCKAAVPGMVKRNYGRIVNTASIAGKEGNPNAAAYSASKAGVIALTKSLGKELAGQNIAVNCITPAAARTAIFAQMKQEHIDYMLSKIPRARFVEVEEVANMVAWLVSAENSFTTGAVFDLSGGRATY